MNKLEKYLLLIFYMQQCFSIPCSVQRAFHSRGDANIIIGEWKKKKLKNKIEFSFFFCIFHFIFFTLWNCIENGQNKKFFFFIYFFLTEIKGLSLSYYDCTVASHEKQKWKPLSAPLITMKNTDSETGM